jgi:hypothetical protein
MRHGWRKRTEICHKILFLCLSFCDRNIIIDAKGLWECGSEPFKSFYVVFSILRMKGTGRKWREWWPSKIDSNWGKHSCCCGFGQKWPSNYVKNDSIIFEHPQICSSSDSERAFEKEKLCVRFFHTPWHPSKGKIESHLAKTLSWWPMQKNFLTELLREMRTGVLPITPKQSDRDLNGLVRHPLDRRNRNSKGPTWRTCWYIFRLSRRTAQEFIPEGKTGNAEL